MQVAFGPGGSSLKTYGTRGKSSGSASKYSANEQNGLTRSSAAIDDQSDTCMIDVTDGTTNASSRQIRREYKEPWVRNCHHSSILFLSVSFSHI